MSAVAEENFDSFSDDEFADSDDDTQAAAAPREVDVPRVKDAASAIATKVPAQATEDSNDHTLEQLEDGFALDPEEQARMDLEHEQVYSANSAFREVKEEDELAAADEAMKALQDALKRSQACDTLEIAQTALQSVDMEVLERQVEIQANLQRSVEQAKPKSKFATLRRKLKSETPLTDGPVLTKKEIKSDLAEKLEENRRRKDEAKRRLVEQFKTQRADDNVKAPPADIVPKDRALVSEWEVTDVQGWLSSVVSKNNFGKWCEIAKEHQLSGSILITTDRSALDRYCKDYYTVTHHKQC